MENEVPYGAVGILLPDPAGVPDAAWEAQLRVLLRHARRAGVALVHAGDGPGAARTLALLPRVLPAPGPWSVIGTPMDDGSDPWGHSSDPASSAGTRFTPEWVLPAGAPRSAPGRPEVRGPRAGAWGIALGDPTKLEAVHAELERTRPAFVRLPFHLLNASAVAPIIERWNRLGIRAVSDDPFAGGLLDGGWLHGSPLELGGPTRPVDWASTRGRLAPIVQLGPLTSAGSRTLPQAALGYLLGRPGVVAVLMRARSAADLQNLRPGGAPLSPEERAWIEDPRRAREPA